MRLLTILAAVFLVAGCGPTDPNKVLINTEFEVPSKKAAFHKFTLDLGGSFTMTLTPKGGNLEAWVEPGEAAPFVVYSDKEAYPKAKVFLDGQEETITGTLGWGGAHVIVFNRSDHPIRAKCRLTVLPTPLK